MKNAKDKKERKNLEVASLKVAEHHHCPICGMPISLEKETCSKECEEAYKKIRRARYQALIPLIVLIATLVILIIRWLQQL
jgi:predicted nucleic acid-binding Zn ribbon protein